MTDFDYVVIGGGVYGCATAWHLAKAGAKVCVLEEKAVASRASGGPGRRGVRANGRDVRELPLMRRAYEHWPDLHRELTAEPFYERTGQLILAETEADVDRLEAQCLLQTLHGIDSEWLDKDAVRALEPALSDTVKGGLFCPKDGVADHGAVTRAYARAAETRGVEFLIGLKASALVQRGDRVRAVRTANGETITARQGVALLGNSEVAAMVRTHLRLPVWNLCLQVLVSKPLTVIPFRHLTGHASRTVSLKREGADRIMISGGWRGIWDPSEQTGIVDPDQVTGNVDEAIAVYPDLRGLEVETADVGHLESFSIDAVPIVDTLSNCPNAWFGTGWGGHGWAIAPTISQDLAAWMISGEKPVELTPFALSRFGY